MPSVQFGTLATLGLACPEIPLDINLYIPIMRLISAMHIACAMDDSLFRAVSAVLDLTSQASLESILTEVKGEHCEEAQLLVLWA